MNLNNKLHQTAADGITVSTFCQNMPPCRFSKKTVRKVQIRQEEKTKMITFVTVKNISLNLRLNHIRMTQTNETRFTPCMRTLAVIFSALILCSTALAHNLDFRCLDTNSGLADSHVRTILKDRSGYIWIGTVTGLSRYDGFRFKNFYSSTTDKTSLLSNQIEDLTLDDNNNLWVQTNEGYCIYNPETESFNRNIATWMAQRGMSGTPNRIFIDSKGNFWIAVNGKGCYFYNNSTHSVHLFAAGKGKDKIPSSSITGITERGASLVVSFENGTLARLDGLARRIVWINRTLEQKSNNRTQYYSTYIDSRYNYWVSNHATGHTYIYSCIARRWFSSPREFFASLGMKVACDVFVKDLKEDSHHNLWLATEHEGLFIANIAKRSINNVRYDGQHPNTLPDNTLQSIYIDRADAVWIGTYKNGIAYYSPSLSHFSTVSLGDICTITTDRIGNYWCGTNESGIVCYNPSTGAKVHQYHMPETHLGSDVVVSSLTAKDGSLWFGSFNGGITHCTAGTFRTYTQQNSTLSNNSVWSIAEDKQGNIVIGTLGGGVQIMNPQTGKFTTYSPDNSRLPSKYVSKVCIDSHDNIVVGHSMGISVINPHSHKVSQLPKTTDGSNFSSISVNDVLVDSRGLIWNANMSGLDVYDPQTRRVYRLYQRQQMASALCEDADGKIWATLSNSVIRIKVMRKDGILNFFTNSFDELDGLQKHRFNYRSICNDGKRNILVGGQDGINIIPSRSQQQIAVNTRVLFSGIVLFDHPLSVGEKYMGRIILENSVNTSRRLDLKYDENAFTVLLATNHVSVQDKCHFMYRLKGFGDDKWLTTVESQPSITYTNLHPGTYTLQVRTVERDGTMGKETSELEIHIAPPFYMSTWAFIIYILSIIAAAWLIWRITIRRQIEKMRIEQIRQEAERNRKMDEMKLSFLTDISHELRTPLSLVISPVKVLIGMESDEKKRTRLELVLRNANRLLNLVNQTLDIRKIETRAMRLNLKQSNIISFIREITDGFSHLSQKNINLLFLTKAESFVMSFDEDKMLKVMNNLLSNAYKFTPEGGKITVSVSCVEKDALSGKQDGRCLLISVADTGCGISNEDKQHVFDRFYQTKHHNESPFGGSGLGLNIAYEYVVMHGGRINVADNIENGGKGTVFTIELPVIENGNVSDSCKENTTGTIDYSSKQATGISDNGNSVQTEGTDLNGSEGTGKDSLSVVGETPNHNGNKEVLIVDDSDDFLTFMSEMLSEHYKVRTAVNGKDALDKIAEHKPDIILSDVMMPEMDGNELCKRVKEEKTTSMIPFVMLTARLSTEHKIEGFTSGADAYITKPFDLDLLSVRIDNLIRSHSVQSDRKEGQEPSDIVKSEKIVPKITEEQITSVDQQLVDKATAFVEQNLDNTELSVEMMSEHLGMSRVHLYKRLLSITGSTPSEFIRIIRLKHAARLLKEGQLNVSEVAYKVGFNLPRNFSRYFKEYFGVGPSQYKK